MQQKQPVTDEPRYWYSAPRYWCGYRHALTWEGWAVDVGLFAIIVAAAPWMHGQRHPFGQLTFFFGVLVAIAAIRHWKGEPDDCGN